MKVYVIIHTIPYEGIDIEGIFKEYDAAVFELKQIAEIHNGYKKDPYSEAYIDKWGDSFTVEEWELK